MTAGNKSVWEKIPPVETPDPLPGRDDASRFTHPAFGMARISNPSGGDGVFFGSEVRAQHFVSLEITEADMVRDLARSWYFPRGELIRIDMTQVQWAELVASGGRSGVPVTIRWVRGEGYRPQIDQVRDISLFQREADKELADREGVTPQDLCERLARDTGYRVATVDLILWRACATGLINSRTGERRVSACLPLPGEEVEAKP